MSSPETPWHRESRSDPMRLWLVVAIPLLLVAVTLLVFLFLRNSNIEHEEKSEYSHIRIRRKGNYRELLFVRDNGVEARQSGFRMDAPSQLTSPYAETMFASYFWLPQQERVLIIGLGGGAMVRFLQHHDADLNVDVVEIDPVVVRLADKYFEARSEGNITILTADGFEYLREAPHQYDVIYFDAFLKPSADTDATGVPQKLKTIAFYESVKTKLTPGGVVVFNLNIHGETTNDLNTIREAFPHVVTFSCSTPNLIAVASPLPVPTETQLQQRAQELDARFQASFSFVDLSRRLDEPP